MSKATAENDNIRRRAKIGEARAFIEDIIARKDEIKGCVFWPFTRDVSGYAKITVGRKPQNAHRYVCIAVNGEPREDKLVAAHNCGNGRLGCVSPFCVRWATYLENSADMVGHGTKLFGERIGDAKLDLQTVRKIHVLRAQGNTSDQIAATLNVRGQQVRRITRGDRWAHAHPSNDPITAEMVAKYKGMVISTDCRVKATDDMIRQAHVMRAKGRTYKDIGLYLNLDQRQAHRIISGERRKKLHPDNDTITAELIRDAS
jgi:hypothetical protein